MRLTLLKRTLKLITMAEHLKSKRPKLCPKSDNSYFESYADINVHEEMLGDEIRTNTYKKAIFSLGSLICNKVVLDVGAGTGILSCFCAQAGAKKVYAVEASSIAQQAKKVVVANGLQNKIEVIQGVLEDIELPEKVDLIVSEWMGYCLLYESMLSSVITARDRWLKPDGVLLPCSACLYLVPVCDDEVVIEKVNFWNDMEEVYGVNMSCILPFARKSLCKEVMVKTISCENILSKPQVLARFNLSTVTQKDIENVRLDFTFNSFGFADFQGFAIWFDVGFPCFNSNKAELPSAGPRNSGDHKDDNNKAVVDGIKETKLNNAAESHEKPTALITKVQTAKLTSSTKKQAIQLSTSPYNEETHWKQSILYLENEVPVKQDSKICGSISLCPSSQNRRFLSIKLSCNIDEEKSIKKSYFMGYELPNGDKVS